jgi:ubiquinone/menaquinone biosynthesis C-methylase UbiE
MGRFLAAIYDRFQRSIEEACLNDWRAELLGDVHGDVLEIGAGTGVNLPHYSPRIARLVLSEPDPHMRRRLLDRLDADRTVEVTPAPAESLDVADASFDAVVSTLVLCSVERPEQALSEVHRVLRPGGRLVFIEHVAAVDNPGRLAWQRRVEPLWKRVAGNCHTTRDTAAAIEAAGLQIEDLRRASFRKALPWVRPSIRGVARKPPPPS